MDNPIPPLTFALCMLFGMLLFLGIGRRIGIYWISRSPDKTKPSFSSIEGPVYALFGLLLAFTFSGAPARLDVRRQLIAQEANAIETAYLRIDLLSPDSQDAMRQRFRDYLDTRLAAYKKLPDVDAAMAELAVSERMQKEIWAESLSASGRSGANPEAAKLMLPALNEMISITRSRLAAGLIHPPFAIFFLLLLISLVISALAGFAVADHPQGSWLHVIAYAVIPAVVVFIILEIEYPRMGVLPVVSSLDRVLVDLRAAMN
jgi:hypothetical protein